MVVYYSGIISSSYAVFVLDQKFYTASKLIQDTKYKN